MMALRQIDNPSIEDLPNARGRTEVGDRVLVRPRRSGTTTGGDWHPAKVIMVARRGIQAKTTDYGKLDFFHWSDVRLEPTPPKKVAVDDALGALGIESSDPAQPQEPTAAPPPPIDPVEVAGLTEGNPTLAIMMRRWRTVRGLTQAAASGMLAVASSTGVHETYYSMFELGKRSPNDEMLLAFAELSGIDIAVLISARDEQRASHPQRRRESEEPGTEEAAEPEPETDDDQPEAAEDVDPDAPEVVSALLKRIEELTEGSDFTVAALVTLIGRDAELTKLFRAQGVGSVMAIGQRFRRLRDRSSGGLVLRHTERYCREGTVWRIEREGAEPAVPAEQAPRTKPATDNFLIWSERLQSLTPVPQDRELRRRWLVLVRELYDIWKKEQ
jgi:transcriptional regulator with XRE-family HTH domain